MTLAYPSTAFASCVDGAGGLDGFGILIPRAASIKTLGFQFPSSLFPSRAPRGEEIVLAYVGGALDAAAADASDAALVAAVDADARAVGLVRRSAPAPEALSVRRWPRGIPQYAPGTAARLAAVRADLPANVLLGGAGAGGGISLGDCVESGYDDAAAVLDRLLEVRD